MDSRTNRRYLHLAAITAAVIAAVTASFTGCGQGDPFTESAEVAPQGYGKIKILADATPTTTSDDGTESVTGEIRPLVDDTGASAGGTEEGETIVTDLPDAHIGIIRVEIKRDDEKSLAFTEENFDLSFLDLAEGTQPVLAKARIPEGRYTEIRLITEAEGYAILFNGDRVPLQVPSGPQTGIKIKLDPPLEIDDEKLQSVYLKFDLSKSFVWTRGGAEMQCKPVIRPEVVVVPDPKSSPSPSPSETPSGTPTDGTGDPTAAPTDTPSGEPTSEPTSEPTGTPTDGGTTPVEEFPTIGV